MKKLSKREEKTQQIRDALYRAAIESIGEFGYAGSTIQIIAHRARVANGTFYNYFPSQGDLFERILPELGEQLRDHVDARLSSTTEASQKEAVLLRGLFEFSNLHPQFYRILTEAETHVPSAHRRYVLEMTAWYKDLFATRLDDGEPRSAEDDEVLAVILLAAHHYLTLRYTRWVGGEGSVPEWVMGAYAKLLAQGFRSAGGASPPSLPSGSRPRGARSAGRTLKFMPSLGSGRPYTNISATAVPLDCRTTLREDGAAVVELDIEPHLLSSVGTGSSALIASLAEIAAISLLAPDREQVLSLKPVSISCNLVRVVQDGTLVAEARAENSGRNLRFVSVRVTRKDEPAKLIANASVLIRLG